MILGEVEFLKPKSGDLIQDRALRRNGIGQNDVEGGKTIADDKEQGIAEVENFAHFSTAQFLNSRKFNVGEHLHVRIIRVAKFVGQALPLAVLRLAAGAAALQLL